MKNNSSVFTIRRMMILLFLLATVSVSLAVGLISWQQNTYSSLRIESLTFHPQSIANISDAKEHLESLEIWAIKATNNQGKILLGERKILSKHPLAILALIKQHVTLLYDRQLARKIEKYKRVADATQNHLLRLTQLIALDDPDKFILAEHVDRLIRSLSLDLQQWRRLHEMDFVQDEVIFNEFKEKTNKLFYLILILLFIISIPLAMLFVRRIKLTLGDIETAQHQLSELNQTLENKVDQRTHELSEIQASLVRNERLAALGQLTGTVSHELRNPLGTITTSLYTLRNKLKITNIDVDKTLDRIDRNVKRCDDIVEDLLQYSRVQDLHFESIDFENWIKEILNDYKYLENLSVKHEIEAVGVINIDPHRLRRVFINLIDNSIRAMSTNNKIRAGSVIWVKVVTDELGVGFSIRDNGIGISADKVAHIFEPLFSTYAFGVGLGLPLVRQILEQHGGTIDLNTDTQDGASFRCWLPYSVVKQEPL